MFDQPEGDLFIKAECKALAEVILRYVPAGTARDHAIQAVQSAMYHSFNAFNYAQIATASGNEIRRGLSNGQQTQGAGNRNGHPGNTSPRDDNR